ncbi:MAG: hypothetical protein HKN87_01125 [Saprospiraceae bacterium]|nr:hypothetical protein [Saprospiraceae bacterium]
MRAHHLFRSGDPRTTALKWISTNVYHEEPSVILFADRYHLTIRQDETSFVT